MKTFLLVASAAAMAVSMPALAKPDKEGGKGNGASQGAKAQKMSGGDFRGGGDFKHAAKAQKQNFKAAEKQVKAERKAVERQFKNEAKRQDRVRNARVDDRRDDWDDDDNRGRFVDRRNSYDGCPPGLAKKNNGCLPPGQARKIAALGQQFNLNQFGQYNIPASYRNFYNDSPDNLYRYDDNGYIYRVDRETNLVSGLIPLLGGGFGVGQALPAGYDVYNVPLQYRDTYYDTDDSYYRYGDNAIYQVDPKTNMIENVVALLTGQNLGIGQTMPAGYDMYNVPTDYRDQYYDNDQYNYRYADGNIYQVDAKTQVIQAIISALT